MNRIIERLSWEKVAIIGFWRSGASYVEISRATQYDVPYIEKVITDYAKTHNVKLEVSETGRLIWK